MASNKIYTLQPLKEHLTPRRLGGERIALANGAFDLLHVGHVRYLQGAKAAADVLVVAVNSDASVRQLKGPSRPIVPTSERLEMVAALGCVDFVVAFDEPTVAAVISALRPDFHAKGSDYTPATVPEAELVRGYGGQVIITGDAKDHSTSSILRVLEEALRNQSPSAPN